MERFLEILLAISTIAVTFVIYKRLSSRSNAPPSLPWLPVVGSLPFLSGISTFHLFLTEEAKRYGNVYSFYAGQRYTVVLNGLDAIREALVKRSTDFAGREKVYAEQLIWNPELRGLAFRQYSQDFKSIRKTSVTALKKLGFGDRATMETKLHEEINECIKHIHGKNGEAFDMEDLFRTFALSILYSLMFGKRIKLDDPIAKFISNCFNLYVECLDPILDLFSLSRYLPKFRKALNDMVPVNKKFKQLITGQLRESINSTNEDEIFVKDCMNNNGGKFDESELYFIVKDFLAAGMYESSTQMLWFILLITNHPTVQERLHKEMDSVVPRERLPSMTDKLPYLEATILEVMRRNTPVPLAVPHTTLCDTEVAGFAIPSNSQVVVNLWSVHMDPIVWPEPQEFRPERFLNENGNVINQDRLIAFSLGKRRCPGEILAHQEIFLILAALLQHFEFRPPLGQEAVLDKGTAHLVYIPHPFKVRVLPRAT